MPTQDRTCIDALLVGQWMELQSVLACDDDILNALESLDHLDLSQEGIEQFKSLVCQLFTSKLYTEVNDCRWLLYSNRAQLTGRVFPNDWIINSDFEKSWRRPSVPPISGRLWLGVWHYQTSLYSSKLFESSSPCSWDALGKKCGCKHGCKMTCMCRNNNLPCIRVCGCVDFSC